MTPAPSPEHATPDRRRWQTPLAWALLGLFVVVLGTTLWLDRRVYATYFPESGLIWLGLHGVWLGPFLVFAAVGALLASRRPRQPIGWLLVAAAVTSGLGEMLRMYAALELGTAASPPLLARLAKIPAEPITVTGLVLGLVLIPVLFPTGELPGRRWRIVPWTAATFLTFYLVNSALSPRLTYALTDPSLGSQVLLYDVANPLSPAALPGALADLPPGATTVLLPVLIVVAGVAVTLRFRRSQGVERQQLKWFVFAAALVAVTAIAQVGLAVVSGPVATPMASILLVLGLSAYPAAIGIAVLRYRLYEIDRIISRTVTYGLVVTVLVGVYVGAVVGLSAAVSAATGAQDSDLAVATATLLAAGLFRPLRTRLRTVVDRRFNRTGYEARRAVEAFAREVRDEVDQPRIRHRTARTAATAVQPTHVSLWLVGDQDGSGP